MLRPLIISVSLLGSLYASANTVEVATDLYSKRGADTQNAKSAADIFGTLAAEASDSVKKAELLISQSEAIYFYGVRQKTKNEKIAVHDEGQAIGLKAANLLKGDHSNDTLRARALYFYGSNLGKWALAKGLKESLSQFNNALKPQMNELISLDDSVEEYGVYRILGLAYVKVPKLIFGGDKKKGMKMLAKAYEKTKVEYDEDFILSKNTTTNIYYLYALAKNKNYKTKFCTLYESMKIFIDEGEEFQAEHNPNLIPETQSEIKTFLNPDKKDDETHYDVKAYAKKSKCN
jgi:hypothetical protein